MQVVIVICVLYSLSSIRELLSSYARSSAVTILISLGLALPS